MAGRGYAHDIEELRNLGQVYARAVDGGDLDRIAGCFTADAMIDGIAGSATVGEFVAKVQSQTGESKMHVLGAPLVRFVEGSDTASLDTYGVVHRWSEASPRSTVAVRYVDDVVRTAAGWRIAHRRTSLLWSD